MERRYRLAVLNSHPVQYFAPLYRKIAETPDIDITVFYCSRQSVASGHIDIGFGHQVIWDRPLLEGYTHRFLPNLGSDRGVRGFFSLLNIGIVREIWKGRFDAIVIHGQNYAVNLLALFAAKFVGTRVFMRAETQLLLKQRGIKKLVRRPLMTVFYRLCDAFLCIGTLNREFYRHHGVSEAKLFLVPYTVDNEFFMQKADEFALVRDQSKVELGMAPKSPVIMYASKLIRRKRPMDLLQAFRLLVQRGIDAELLIIGDGPEKAELESFARSSKLDRVFFLGFKNQSELPRYYAMAEVFVLPSEDEPWGLIINEVMCAGVPVVTTDKVGAHTDLVTPGETGYCYKVGDIAGLAESLARILGDSALRKRLSAGARHRISRWSYKEDIEGIRAALMN